ncbi:hypothetical protein Nepgr_008865 [Nepenthes gracilis]|uniref:Uncharacterized protein n=1 Tax=Nepenthes gracilis TaxID=150966 RepID=A0AAD3S9G2_NEPGR|nr:hypothetical protein Nepgr_008865 [Nepenthes gracilis]
MTGIGAALRMEPNDLSCIMKKRGVDERAMGSVEPSVQLKGVVLILRSIFLLRNYKLREMEVEYSFVDHQPNKKRLKDNFKTKTKFSAHDGGFGQCYPARSQVIFEEMDVSLEIEPPELLGLLCPQFALERWRLSFVAVPPLKVTPHVFLLPEDLDVVMRTFKYLACIALP